MLFKFKTKNFVSEIDQMLADFDKNHSKSESQQAEIDKYTKISDQRDNKD